MSLTELSAEGVNDEIGVMRNSFDKIEKEIVFLKKPGF